jgi:DNA polymerase III alpha subunit (gram-positive type)
MFHLLNELAKEGEIMFHDLTIVYDFETTGLIQRTPNKTIYPEIIEMSACDYETGLIIIDYVVKPTKKLENFISELTGITQKMIDKTGLSFDEFSKRTIDRFSRISESRLIAHNGTLFDHPILKYYELIKFNLIDGFDFLDSMSLIPVHLPDGEKLTSKKLVEIYKYLFQADFSAHRAMSDVNALIRIMRHLNIHF